MQLVKYIIIYFLLLFVEKNLLHLISIKEVTPDLILIFVIIISLGEKKSKATIIGFFAGLIQDVFTTGFFGLSALTKTIVGFWGTFFQQPKKRYNLSTYAIAVSILVIVHEIIFRFIYNLGTHIGFFQLVVQIMFPRALYTLLFALIIYLIFKPMFWKSEHILE
ncbi:MAG: rod shape-determining protein MreD [bacterium]|nr:MAG: rod shape-determining protein MreD [bacterium]